MRKTKLTKLILFKENECEAMGKYLEEKALEGWFLEDISCGFFTFKKSEPKKCKFIVDIFYKLKSGEYIQDCESKGWNYIAERDKYFIFYSDNEDATPIKRDKEYMLKKVGKSMINYIFYYIFLLYLIISPIYDIFFKNEYGHEVYGNYYLFLVLISITFIICILWNIVRGGLWYLKFKKSINLEEKITYPSLKELKISINMSNLCISIFLVVVLSLIVGLGEKESYLYTGLVIMAIIVYMRKIIKIIKS